MPNYKFTVPEKVAMVQQHYQGISYRRISDYFAAAYPDRPIPTHVTIKNIVKKFEETGNVDGRSSKVSQPNKQLNWETKLQICLSVEADPFKPASRIAQEIGVSKSSVRKVLRAAKYKSYKVGNHQQLFAQDRERRMLFCEQMTEALNQNPAMRVCYSDESTVFLVGKPNRQNYRVWSQHNPEVFVQSGTQYPIKVNVWVGLVENHIIGPFFIDGNLTGQKYLELLREHIVPAIRVIEADGTKIWFQQDGAPPHFTRAVREYLNEQFPGRWIGRGSPTMQWPPRSPDLSPLDFGLWAYLKNRLYSRERIENRGALQARITDILANISPQHVANMTGGVYNRLGHCTLARSAHFENR